MRGGLAVMDGSAGLEAFAEPVMSLRMADGSEVRRPLRDVRVRQVVVAVPWPLSGQAITRPDQVSEHARTTVVLNPAPRLSLGRFR